MGQMQDYTVVITVGRNVGDEPMSRGRWSLLRAELDKLFGFYFPANVVQRPPYNVDQGQNGTWEGTTEEQADAWVALVRWDDMDIWRVKRELRDIARQYGQEAIGFILVEGQDHMIWSDQKL